MADKKFVTNVAIGIMNNGEFTRIPDCYMHTYTIGNTVNLSDFFLKVSYNDGEPEIKCVYEMKNAYIVYTLEDDNGQYPIFKKPNPEEEVYILQNSTGNGGVKWGKEAVTGIGKDGKVYGIVYDGEFYTTNVSAVQTDSSSSDTELGKYKVKPAKGLNFRKEPNGTLIVSIPFGTEINVIAIKESKGEKWGQIEYEGNSGWVCLPYCELIERAKIPTNTATTSSNKKLDEISYGIKGISIFYYYKDSNGKDASESFTINVEIIKPEITFNHVDSNGTPQKTNIREIYTTGLSDNNVQWGSNLDLSSLNVMAYIDDNHTASVSLTEILKDVDNNTYGYTISGYDPSKIGKQQVTVTFQDGEDVFNTYFEVNVTQANMEYEQIQAARLQIQGARNVELMNNDIDSIIKDLETSTGTTLDDKDKQGLKNNLLTIYDQSLQFIDNILGESMDSFFNSEISILNVVGMPPQFNDMADPRLLSSSIRQVPTAYGDGIGRMFYQYYTNDIPLVMIQPGVPQFMPSVNLFDKVKLEKGTLQTLIEESGDPALVNIGNMSVTDMVEFQKNTINDTRYYGFKSDFTTYCNYVNTMVRRAAVMMGLSKYANFVLQDESKGGFGRNWLLRNSMAFFYNTSGTSFSEQQSNQTTESMLASATKTAGSTKREIDFILGSGSAKNLTDGDYADYEAKVRNLFGTASKDPTSFISRLTSSAKTIWNGGNLLFPSIWSDSSYAPSINLEFTFFSPYGDKESILRNVYIPFFCALALTLPHQITTQGYSAPFVLRVQTKGWFSCSLGICTSLSIRKGDNEGWTKDGLPTSITVSLGIEDLYPTLMMSQDSNTRVLTNNTGFLEYLDTMAGVGFNDINIGRQMEYLLSSKWNKIGGAPNQLMNKVYQSMGNIANKANTIFAR